MFNIISFDKLDSTNRYVLNNIGALHNLDVILCYNQTSGRGRLGRTWLSDEGSLCFTIVLKGDDIKNRFSSLSVLSASSMVLALRSLGFIPQYKWPNDVYVNDKKICGILLESRSNEDFVALGIGLNVNNVKRPIDTATSLYLETGRHFDLNDVLGTYLDNFERLYIDLISGGNEYLQIARNHNYLINKTVASDIGTVTVTGISDDNCLEVLQNGDKKSLFTGEITFHV